LFNIVLATLYAITIPSLAALGERSLDVYVSMFTLEYFICLAILRPRRLVKDFIAVALFIAFAVAVAYRIMEVLSL
jgi:hypothetical protein